jgi:hypothetical protein
MQLVNVPEKDLGKLWGITIRDCGGNVDHFGQLVYKDTNSVIAVVCFGQVCDKVKGNYFPSVPWNRQRHKFACTRPVQWLVSLTNVALLDLSLDKVPEAWPPEISSDQLLCFLHTKVACIDMSMRSPKIFGL